jgi:Kdo2-lipid IVA lauroyltransferase/acyltransferase
MSDRLPAWRRWRRRAWYLTACVVLHLVQSIPPTVGRGLCRSLARLALLLRRRERALAQRNLALVFPDQDRRWRARLLRQAAASLGENLYAALTLERQAARGFPVVVATGQPAAATGSVGGAGHGDEDLPALLRRLQQAGRGVLLVTAHLGCWELLGAWLAGQLDRPAVVTATVHNPAVDRLLQDRRRALGLEPLPRDQGPRPLLRALGRGAVVGVLLDQNTRAAGAMVPFLGRPAPTPLGVLTIARRRGVPLVPAAAVREDGRWVIQHLAPIDPAPDADLEVLAGRLNRALEALIRRNPAQWVWFHDRWNLQAAGQPGSS